MQPSLPSRIMNDSKLYAIYASASLISEIRATTMLIYGKELKVTNNMYRSGKIDQIWPQSRNTSEHNT
jgi:hypothetical protein